MNSATTRRKAPEGFVGLQSAPAASAGPHTIAQIHAFAVPGSGMESAYSVLQVNTHSGITGYGECRPLTRADMDAPNRTKGEN